MRERADEVRSVLVLGGTGEGRRLATDLVDTLPDNGFRVVTSMAGRLPDSESPPGHLRTGGFGGADGLVEYLTRERISAVVDATHPFAARITAHAAQACERASVPLLVLRRPAWSAGPGDRWTSAPSLPAAAAVVSELDPQVTVLLTTGRQGVSAFAAAPQRFWVRCIEPPQEPVPRRSRVLTARGPFDADGEEALMRRLGIDVLVSKNSGGDLTVAKLIAARRLRLPVVMVDRPHLPSAVRTVPDVGEAHAWALRALA